MEIKLTVARYNSKSFGGVDNILANVDKASLLSC